MNQRAIPPCRFVCGACGKTSATRYGFDADHSPGWDVSCATHAILCKPGNGNPPWWAIGEPVAGEHFEPVADLPAELA